MRPRQPQAVAAGLVRADHLGAGADAAEAGRDAPRARLEGGTSVMDGGVGRRAAIAQPRTRRPVDGLPAREAPRCRPNP